MFLTAIMDKSDNSSVGARGGKPGPTEPTEQSQAYNMRVDSVTNEPSKVNLNARPDASKPKAKTSSRKGKQPKGSRGNILTVSTANNDVTDTSETSKRLDRLESLIEGMVASMTTQPAVYYQSEGETEVQDLPEQPSSVLTHTTGDVEQNDFEQLSGSQSKTSQVKSVEMEKPKALGFAARFATPENTGEPISDQLASSIDYLLSSKLEEKHLTETMDKYPQPRNSNNLLVPKVNPLMWENVLSKTRSLDLKLQRCQKPLVTGLIAMVKSFEGNEPSEVQQDAVALLSNAMFELNNVRKELIKPDLHQRYSHLCKQSQLTTQWLFGDDLPKKVKEIDEEHKAVAVMKTPQTKYANPSPTSTHRFNPMRPSTATRGFTRYQRAGWSARSRAQSQSQSAFLGQPRFNLSSYRIPNKARDVPKRGKRTVDSDRRM